jgi:hypothetical protein
MGMSNYSNFIDGVTIRDVPIQQLHPGKVFWVNNSSVLPPGGIGGSDNNPGTYLKPFATVDYAIGRCTAGRGDIIAVMPGHTGTISGAAGIAQDVEGVAIVGLGDGSNRPTFTFSNTAATWAISANNCSVKNIVVTPSVDSVVKAFNVSGADCYLGVESQDASSAVEFVNIITTTAAADRIKVDLKHRGFTAGNAGVAAIALVGADNADINVDFYGNNSTAVVNMLTTACLGVQVRGVFNNGTTALTKNVVDTVGTSKWIAEGLDEVAGVRFIGGSGAGISATSGVVETTVARPTAALPQTASSAIFTITGGPILLMNIVGEVTTAIQNQADNTKLVAAPTVGSATDLCAVTDIANDAVGTFYNITGTLANALVKAANGTAIGQAGTVVIPAGTINLSCAASNTGSVAWRIRYKPLAPGVTVTAA